MDEEMIENVVAPNTEEKAGGVQGNDENDGEKLNPVESEKKYSDADLDRILARKIAKERERMSKVFSNEQQESDVEIRERKVLERELKAEVKDVLISHSLPSSLANLVTYSSKEECEQSLKEVEQVFTEAVSNEIRRTLSGKTPRTGTGSFTGNSMDNKLQSAFAPKAL